MDAFTIYRAWKADLERYEPPDLARHHWRRGLEAIADLGVSPADWSRASLQRYFEQMTSASAKHYRPALRHFTRWMLAHGFIVADPLEEVVTRFGRRAKRLKRGLELGELAVVCEIIERPTARPGWNESRHRLRLMVQGQYLTGLRPIEHVPLMRSSVFLDDRPRIEIFATKTSTERAVPLNDEAAAIYAELVHGRDGRLFTITRATYRDQFGTAARRAGLPAQKCRPYALRHSFAYQLIRAGVHISRVAQLMGHADVKTTMEYLDADDPELRECVGRIFLPQQNQAA